MPSSALATLVRRRVEALKKRSDFAGLGPFQAEKVKVGRANITLSTWIDRGRSEVRVVVQANRPSASGRGGLEVQGFGRSQAGAVRDLTPAELREFK